MKVSDLPSGTAPEALQFEHFPTRWQAVLWRNWNLIAPERIADVLRTTEENIETAAMKLGLVRDDAELQLWRERGFLTIIRRNWELLPYEQLLELLDWSPEKLAFVLKEDDFMWGKMGRLKPRCEAVSYAPLNSEERIETAEIKKLMDEKFSLLPEKTDRPFSFLQHYGQNKVVQTRNDFDLKMIYSYSAVFGDPLLDETLDPYPDALLADYAATGVNAVWLPGTLYTLVPWLGENEKCSENWRVRLDNLRNLAKKVKNHGLKLFLYMNEPRCMPDDFFINHPEWQGVAADNLNAFAMCTSSGTLLQALEKGVERLCREVPELGGIFTITMSENQTHCKSRFHKAVCPRCAIRPVADLVAEVNCAIAAGAARGNPQARVISWNWAWSPEWDADVLAKLPDNVTLMSVSETLKETDCLGIKGIVYDYSISKVGPGSTALRIWRMARQRSLRITAKVQLNNTWEISAVPYIPVPGLIERHLKNLKEAGVTDLMLSWTLGGYPGGNLELLNSSKEELALRKFGEKAAPEVLKAWDIFDHAFEKFPLNGTSQLYTAPQNYGPMSLLWPDPTGRRATMIGFPFDDLFVWRGDHYPEDIFEEVFRQISEEWKCGVEILQRTEHLTTASEHENWQDLMNVAETIYCHFRSTYLQICFVRRRDSGNDYCEIVSEEEALAIELYQVMRRDSRIGFEASNHYFYVENDLKEKVLNCRSVLKKYRICK